MKLVFEIEPYEDMLEDPFSLDTYFNCRMNISIFQNGIEKEFCTSTFNSAILLELAGGLIEIYEKQETQFVIEMYESTYEYTFS